MCSVLWIYGWSVNKHSSLLHPYWPWKWRLPKRLVKNSIQNQETKPLMKSENINFASVYPSVLPVWFWLTLGVCISSPFDKVSCPPRNLALPIWAFLSISDKLKKEVAPLPAASSCACSAFPFAPTHVFEQKEVYPGTDLLSVNLHPPRKVNFNWLIVEVTP